MLGVDPSRAVDNPLIGFLGPVKDVGVTLHSLEKKFDTLDRGHEGFGDCPDETAEEKVGEELGETGGFGGLLCRLGGRRCGGHGKGREDKEGRKKREMNPMLCLFLNTGT